MYSVKFAQSKPNDAAYVMTGSGEVVTWQQLEDRSNQAAQLFRSRGIQAGDSIAIVMGNTARFIELCWASARSGLRYTAVSYRLKLDEVNYIVENCEAKAIFATSDISDVVGNVETGTLEHRFAVGGDIAGFESYEQARDAMPAERISDESLGRDMLYSSGTTGRPKGVVASGALSQGADGFDEVPALSQMLMLLYSIDDKSKYLSPAPLYHAAPLRFCMAVLSIGGTLYVMEKFEPEDYLAQVQKHKIDSTQLVPTMFVRMLKLDEDVRAQYDVSSIKTAIHAAAPCPVDVKHQMIDWWGKGIFEYYAGSEGNGMTLITSEEWLANPGSVGRAVLGEVHILDEEFNPVPTGETGTVFFGGTEPFSYYKDDQKTDSSRSPQGFTTLGDVGYVNEEGYLFLTDRKAFMIISGGVNIYPQATEDALVTHDKVMDAAVFGVPNPDFGEEVKAVVQPRDWSDAGPALEAELIAHCRSKVSHIAAPKSVDFEQELPRHPTGKLYKRLLKDRYWQGDKKI